MMENGEMEGGHFRERRQREPKHQDGVTEDVSEGGQQASLGLGSEGPTEVSRVMEMSIAHRPVAQPRAPRDQPSSP